MSLLLDTKPVSRDAFYELPTDVDNAKVFDIYGVDVDANVIRQVKRLFVSKEKTVAELRVILTMALKEVGCGG